MTLCSPSPLRLRPLEISEDVRATLMLLGLEYVWDSTNNEETWMFRPTRELRSGTEQERQ
jgi:hypothetical protein